MLTIFSSIVVLTLEWNWMLLFPWITLMHCQNKMDEGLFMQITANLNLKKKTEHTRTFYDYCSVHSALFQNKLFSLFTSAGWHLSPFITQNFQFWSLVGLIIHWEGVIHRLPNDFWKIKKIFMIKSRVQQLTYNSSWLTVIATVGTF